MSLDRSEIETIARLARLSLGAREQGQYGTDLGNILGLVKQMNSIDTNGVTPLAHPQEISAPLREDQVTEENRRDDNQASAPKVEAGYYLVPRVIE